MPTPLIRALQNRDRDALASLLAADVTFNSPVRTYRGRDEVVPLLGVIAGILDELTPSREIGQGDAVVTVFSGRVAGEPVEFDGVLIEMAADSGAVGELTLMLRPLTALRAAIGKMAQALGAGHYGDS